MKKSSLRIFILSFLLILSISSQASIRLATYNIRNFDYDERYRISTNKPYLKKILEEISADLIAVQEINNTEEFRRFIKSHFPHYEVALSACGGAHRQHLGFVYDQRKIELLSTEEDTHFNLNDHNCLGGSRPAFIGVFKYIDQKEPFVAVSLHLKSGSKADSIQKRISQYDLIGRLKSRYEKIGYSHFVLMGDMNTTGFLNQMYDHQAFINMILQNQFEDLGKNLKCTAYWWGLTDDNIEEPSVLDHILISKSLRSKSGIETNALGHCQKVSCKSASVDELGASYQGVSDHCPILAQFK